VLELDRLDRAILRLRGQGLQVSATGELASGTGELAREREEVRAAIRAVGSRLET
jgi:hypothetical protein